MHAFQRQVRQSLRRLRANPGLTAGAILTLALGIGANTAVFSVVYGVLLRDLPYPEPERLVTVWQEKNFNAAMVRETLAGVPALQSLAGVSGWTVTLTGDGPPEELDAALVSPSYFEVLSVPPLIGRSFREEEALPGAGGVAILSHALWQRRFGGDPGVIGQVVPIGGAEHLRREIVGVMPAGLHSPVQAVDLWLPLEADPALSVAEDRTWYVNWRVGRLRPDATIAGASAQLAAVALRLRSDFPTMFDEDDPRTAVVEPLRALLSGELASGLWTLLAAVGLVLLLACANVANLLLAHGERRERELAVRRALGAGRAQVVRQMLVDGVLLAAAGAFVGVLAAGPALDALLGLAPADLPGATVISIDPAVLWFSVGLAGLAALLSGIVPALRAAGNDPAAALAGSGRGAAGQRLRPSQVLIGVETALALVLLVACGLMLRSLGRLGDVDTGFDGDHLLVLKPNPPADRYQGGEAFRTYQEQLFERLQQIPEVEAVGGIQLLPMTPSNWGFPTIVEGNEPAPGEPPPAVNYRVVTPGYFQTMRIPLLAGRGLTPEDDERAPRVALVNRALVEAYWPTEDPIGKTLHPFSSANEPLTVVGVVGDVRQFSLDRVARPEYYVPPRQHPWPELTLWTMVRTRVAPEGLAETVRTAVWSIDRDVPIAGLEPMQQVIDRSMSRSRFLAVLLTVFGALAALLGSVGVFSVTSYAMARRLPELGVRLALGAPRQRLLLHTLAQGLRPVLFGGLGGFVLAAGASRLLSSLLFETRPSDPLTWVAVALLLLGAATVAVALPARRAMRVDPAIVLRPS